MRHQEVDPEREFVVDGEKLSGGVVEMAPAKHDVNCEKRQATDGLLKSWAIIPKGPLDRDMNDYASKMRDSVQALILREIKVVRWYLRFNSLHLPIISLHELWLS